MIKERYDKWINHPNLDRSYMPELAAMNEDEKQDAFYTDIAFGTAGMRGILGAGTNRINLHTIRKANVGFAQYICKRGEQAKKRGVAIGYDNRHMSIEFAKDSALLLASFGISSYVFDALRPTPELSFAVRYHNCFGGIMITASHNPKEYNGYKLYDEQGCQLVPELAEEVISNVNAIEDALSIVIDESGVDQSLIHTIEPVVDEAYYEAVLGIQMNPQVKKDDVMIIFSPQHGTANIPVKTVFERAGYKFIAVEEQCRPDPDFSKTKTPNPEEAAAYELPIEYAKKNDADLILICDPDADRMGVGVKYRDQYVLLSGNQSGAILIEYILSQLKSSNKMPDNPVMFNTVVTSDLGEMIAKSYGVETIKTLTGFKFIGEKIEMYMQNKQKQYVFGYEESYGSLIAPFVRDKDAQQACLMLAEAACYYHAQNKTLVDVLHDLYKQHGYYEESQVSLTLQGQAGAEKINAILEKLRSSHLSEINGVKVLKFEDYQNGVVEVDALESELKGFTPAEVLKYYLEDGCWIAIRPSGTEPKCKFYYCIKGQSQQEAVAKTKEYQAAIKRLTDI